MVWVRMLVAAATGLMMTVAVSPQGSAAMPEADGAPSATTTAWTGHGFDVDVPNVVRRSNIVLDRPPIRPADSMPLGNGVMGTAVWAENGFTAQLERTDTFPTHRSPGHVVIPGLQAMTDAPDYKATVDLYDGVYRQTGGGMSATTYVREGEDELVVEVTGADPASAQTAQVNLQPGRNPQAGAENGIARLAETWVDNDPAAGGGGSGQTFGSLAAVTAGGRDVTASVVDARTAQVSFRPRPDGSFRVVVAVPQWTGGDAGATAHRLLAGDAERDDTALMGAHLRWWHDYWSRVGLIKLGSADGVADYMENIRTIYLYVAASSERGRLPSSQAGVNDLFNFTRDNQQWGGGHYWFWNLRMQIAANIGAGATDLNAPFFRLYRDNLDSMRTWTRERMNGRPGICVPETMRFDGTGWYLSGGSTETNSSCDASGEPMWNKRNITTGAEVGLFVWRQYLATDDQAFLKANYPLIADAARFLLSYATVGTDGKLHTAPSNAHESQWDVHDPITDIAAMKALFPVAVQAATLLDADADLVAQLQEAIPRIPDFPRTDRATHRQLKTAADDGDGETVLGFSSDPAAPIRNSENLDLEPVWPYDLISDTSPLFGLARLTYTSRRNTNSNSWTYDPVHAARLGLGSEVAARLTASTARFQGYANGLAAFNSSLQEPYDEHAGVTTLAINETLAQDHDGLLRIAPALPPGWDAEGTVQLQHRSRVHVQVQHGEITTVAIESGADHDVRVRNPWPQAQVVDGKQPGRVVVPPTSASTLVIHAERGGSYLVQRPGAPELPEAPVTGTPATQARHLAGSNAKIGLDPPGFEPPTPCPIPTARPLVAWDPTSGDTVRDSSTFGRNGSWQGSPTYVATGPTGSSASLDDGRFLRTAQTTLGFLREATFAAEIKVNPTAGFRRLWDWKIPGGGDGDGFLIDLTPDGHVRFIASGRNVTTDAVLPTGRFVDLVVTAGRDGKLNVYADGARIGGGDLPDLGINGCAPAELRFGADQGGGQRISAEVDRSAIFPTVLADVKGWQQVAFGQ
jgi:glycosyl hydrolase family 95